MARSRALAAGLVQRARVIRAIAAGESYAELCRTTRRLVARLGLII